MSDGMTDAPPRVIPAGPRIARKAAEARRARRSFLLSRVTWVSAAVVPFVLVGWVLLASPWLAVKKVVVVGEHRLTVAAILRAADVRLGTPLARIDTGAISTRVRALGLVMSVSVSRDWPSTLRVSVTEREPVAVAGHGASWTLVDGTGTSLGAVAAPPAGVVRLGVTTPSASDPSTRAALTVLTGLPPAIRSLVVAVQAASPEQVVLGLADGRRVIWGGASDDAAKAKVLLLLLKMPGHVYDVSSPNVVTRR